MWCDVVGILCRPGSCKYRPGCEPHRPEHERAEDMSPADEHYKGQERIRRSRAASLGYPDGKVPKHLFNLVNM